MLVQLLLFVFDQFFVLSLMLDQYLRRHLDHKCNPNDKLVLAFPMVTRLPVSLVSVQNHQNHLNDIEALSQHNLFHSTNI